MLCRLFSWICLLVVNGLPAQNAQPPWHNYTTDQGLPSNEVHCIFQDRDGLMWFGTDNGLSCFDGYTVKNFGPREGLGDNVVFNLQQDSLGRIWMNTISGRIYYFWEDRIHPYRYNDSILQYNNQYTKAKEFRVDDKGTLYASFNALGILHIDNQGKKQLFQAQQFAEGFGMEIGESFLYSFDVSIPTINPDSFRRIFFLEKKIPPIELLLDTVRFRTKTFDLGNYDHIERVFKIGKDSFLASSGSKMCFFDLAGNTWESDVPYFEEILQTREGIFTCHLYGPGLRRYASLDALKRNVFETLLNGYKIAQAYQDRQGGMWVATLEKGLFYTANLNSRIYKEGSGLNASNFQCIEINQAGEIFAGLWNGGLFKLEKTRNTWIPLFFSPNEEPVMDLFFDKKKKSVLVGRGKSYFISDKSEIHDFEVLNTISEKGPLPGKKLIPSPSGNKCWVSSHMGFYCIDLDKMRVT